jgi:1-acyl-sn-glycerol-3-phosphate acyltransferase
MAVSLLPPRPVRRLVLAPAVVLAALGLAVTVPVWAVLLLAAVPLLPGRQRALRVLWFVTVYLALETAALFVLLGLWLASGLGWKVRSPAFQRAHYALVRWYLRVVMAEARRVLRVTVRVEGPDPQEYLDRPLVIVSRHAGPGDSLLLVDRLMNGYAREPRIVLKDTLQWDPAVDIVLNRLPNRFVSPTPGGRAEAVQAQIADLARDLDGDDALLIFPEGGNFTPRRRYRAIAGLRLRGLVREARAATRMRNVMAPKPGGVGAALDACPDADVVIVAHTGLDHMLTVGDVWRELALDRTVVMRWWLVPAAEVPRGDEEAQARWLYGWWEQVDQWIGAHRAAPVADGAPSA